MKKLATLSALLLLATLILLPATSNGKYNVSKPTIADGNPFPPLPPGPSNLGVLVADGNPFPPLPPGPSNLGVLVADGNPFPPLPPGPSATLV